MSSQATYSTSRLAAVTTPSMAAVNTSNSPARRCSPARSATKYRVAYSITRVPMPVTNPAMSREKASRRRSSDNPSVGTHRIDSVGTDPSSTPPA